jgi:hypothetical protein
MFMRLFLLSVIWLASTFKVHAQKEENWVMYIAEIEHKPASILVDLAPHDAAPNKLLPYLVICGPKYDKPSNGLPNPEQIAELEKKLDAADQMLTGVTAKKLMGTFTYNGERLNYYYVKDTTDIAKALGRLYKRRFPDAAYVCKIKYDPNWTTYNQFLYPSEKDIDWMENNSRIVYLLGQGDSLKKPRDISFICLFEKESDRSKFIAFAKEKHYEITETKYMQRADYHYEVKISTFSAVLPEVIQQTSAEIKTETKKYKAQYLGWMCSVISDK